MITGFTGLAQPYKGLYVNNFQSIINSQTGIDSLLQYAQNNNFTTLTLYDLWPIHQQYNLTSVSGSQVLANFINKAKTQYGIQEIAATGENYWFFNTVIHAYNQMHGFSNEKIDVYNLEFEFWNTNPAVANYYCSSYLAPNNIPCTVQGAYSFYLSELQNIHNLAINDGCLTETYLGWPDSSQAVGIIPHVDRVFIHAYLSNPANAFGYTLSRLEDFGSAGAEVKVIPLFSSEPGFMGPWLASHNEPDAFNHYQTAYNSATGSWKQNIDLHGYQWYKYTTMPYTWPEAIAGNKGGQSLDVRDVTRESIRIGTTRSSLNISNSFQGAVVVRIHDLSGKLIQQTNAQLNRGVTEVPLNQQLNGVHVVTITDAANGKVLLRDKVLMGMN
jgi:hypothetical protein